MARKMEEKLAELQRLKRRVRALETEVRMAESDVLENAEVRVGKLFWKVQDKAYILITKITKRTKNAIYCEVSELSRYDSSHLVQLIYQDGSQIGFMKTDELYFLNTHKTRLAASDIIHIKPVSALEMLIRHGLVKNQVETLMAKAATIDEINMVAALIGGRLQLVLGALTHPNNVVLKEQDI